LALALWLRIRHRRGPARDHRLAERRDLHRIAAPRSLSVTTQLGRHTALVAVAALFIVPTYMVIVNAFKTRVDILRSPLDIPVDRLTAANFASVLNQTTAPIGEAYLLSTALALISAVGVVVCGSMLSYVVARMRGPWSDRLFIFLFLGLIVPPQVVVIPVVKVLTVLGLLDTLTGLIMYEIALH